MYIVNRIIFLIKVLFIFGSEYLLYKITNNYEQFIERLAQRLSSVNILCVKIFQAISSNNSLIDEKINNKLIQFTDNAPWSCSDIDYKYLIDLSNKFNLDLKKGYEVPINSGMISLVFKVYKNDEPVIIKIKRKKYSEQIR
jgi:hypothetical protein